MFDLHLGRAVPALAVDQPEHVPHAVDEQASRFEAVVSVTDDAAARHVVGVIGFDAVSVGHLARQVAVVERNLRKGPDRGLALVVRTVAVVEVPRAVVQFRPQGAVLRIVQVVGDGRFAQGDRFALLVRELLRIEQFPGFRVVHVQFTANELIVHLGHRRIEGTLRQAVQRKDQPLDSVVHLAGVLILEFPGDQRGITLPFELGDLLAEAEHAFGQRVAELPFEVGDGPGHRLPADLADTSQGIGRRHQPQHRLDDGGVYRVFVDLLRRKGRTVVETEGRKVAPRLGIGRVVRPKPLLQRHRRDVRFAFPDGRTVFPRQTVEYDQSLSSVTSSASPADFAPLNHLFVVRFRHDLQKFRLRNTKYVIKILHLSFPVLPWPDSNRQPSILDRARPFIDALPIELHGRLFHVIFSS